MRLRFFSSPSQGKFPNQSEMLNRRVDAKFNAKLAVGAGATKPLSRAPFGLMIGVLLGAVLSCGPVFQISELRAQQIGAEQDFLPFPSGSSRSSAPSTPSGAARSSAPSSAPAQPASPGTARVDRVERRALAPLQGPNGIDLTGRQKSNSNFAIDRSSVAPGRVKRGQFNADLGSAPFPGDLWRGLMLNEMKPLLAQLNLPAASPAIRGALARAFASSAIAPSGEGEEGQFLALRLEMLFQLGQMQRIINFVNPDQAQNQARNHPIMQTYYAKALFSLASQERACQQASKIPLRGVRMPKQTLGDALLLVGYCAAVAGRVEETQIMSALLRDQNIASAYQRRMLDNVARSIRPGKKDIKFGLQSGGMIEFALLRRALAKKGRSAAAHKILRRAKARAQFLNRAEPALLARLGTQLGENEAGLRLMAAEKAAQRSAAGARLLQELYQNTLLLKKLGTSPSAQQAVQAARLWQSFVQNNEPLGRVQYMRDFYKIMRQRNLSWAASLMVAPYIRDLPHDRSLLPFMADIIEITLVSGQIQQAAEWLTYARAVDPAGAANLAHWLILIDIAQTNTFNANADNVGAGDAGVQQARLQQSSNIPTGAGLQIAQELARTGFLKPRLLHSLVTVLDALEYNVPIPLWDAANQTPQPTKGYLPPTGQLSRLKAAAEQKQIGHSLLLGAASLGPKGPEGANLLALGDVIRAYKRAGLEHEARRIGFEALYALWPAHAGG